MCWPGCSAQVDAAVDGLGGVKIEEQVGTVANYAPYGELSGGENSLG